MTPCHDLNECLGTSNLEENSEENVKIMTDGLNRPATPVPAKLSGTPKKLRTLLRGKPQGQGISGSAIV